jgi:Flp pilus assembly protein TadG
MNPQFPDLQNTVHRHKPAERGQTLVLFMLMIVILFVFVGMGVDLGFAYVTKARLSKAVDSAALTGMRNLYQGQAQAALVASNAFAANYGTSGRDVAAPTLTVNFGTVNGNTVINVSATVAVNTYFIRALPAIGLGNWNTLSVGSSAQATRAQLYMMVVLDRSGSMGCNPSSCADCSGGGQFLASSVTSFINNFDDNNDVVGEDSFSTLVTLDVAMENHFKTPIINSVNGMNFDGWTYANGGLQTALSQFNALPASATNGINAQKVLVFFTDGYANTSQKTLSCSATPVMMSQSDPICNTTGPWGIAFESSSDGSSIYCSSLNFTSVNGHVESISQYNQNVWNEGELTALNTASTLRGEGVTIYTIGLATGVPPVVNTTFLAELANINDPSDQTYNSNQTVGDMEIAPSGAQLQQAFQEIASKILLRLSQ